MRRSVVIGAGPAGLSAALTLGCDPQREVVLLDAGIGPPSAAGDAVRWLLNGDPTRRYYLAGTGAGGGALVNAGLLGPVDLAIDGLLSREVALGPIGSALAASAGDTERVAVLDRADGTTPAIALGWSTPASDGVVLRRGCRVHRIELSGNRVVGVRTDRGDVAADEVYVAGGAVSTPLLLLDSGVDAPGIGAGWRDHPALTVSMSTGDSAAVSSELVSGGRVVVSAVLPIWSNRRSGGPFGMVYAVESFGPQSGVGGGVIVALFESHRRGSVARCPMTGAPVIDLGERVDTSRLVELWGKVWPIFKHRAWSALIGDATVDEWGTSVEELRTAGAVERWVGRSGGLYHAAGTSSQVVDPDGAVNGYRGLFVADISRLASPPAWPMVASLASGKAVAEARLR